MATEKPSDGKPRNAGSQFFDKIGGAMTMASLIEDMSKLTRADLEDVLCRYEEQHLTR